MAKTQRSVNFPNEVFDWFNRVERETGVPHSRIMLAAVIAYQNADKMTRDRWMQIAVGVDKGELSFDDVPELVARQEVEKWERLAKCPPGQVRKSPTVCLREAKERLEAIRAAKRP